MTRDTSPRSSAIAGPVEPTRLWRWLMLVNVALVCISAIAVTVERVSPADGGLLHRSSVFAGFWLHVNDEQNLPTWYSSLLFAVVALAAADVARSERFTRRTPWWTWAVLAGAFCVLSFDETSQVHDRVEWLALGLPLLGLGLAVLLIPLLRALPRPLALRFVVAGAVFVGGSVLMELASTVLPDAQQVFVHLEELAEMAGATILLVAIVSYRGIAAGRRPAAAAERPR